MYVYQNGRLYVKKGGYLIGVCITSSGVAISTEVHDKDDGSGVSLTEYEVMCKFGIYDGGSYSFPLPAEKPKEIKEVKLEDEPIVVVKKPTRGRPRK